ncbi:unnamed protein product [Merluccius merluccius]
MAVHIRVLTRRCVPWTNPACIGQSGVPWRRARMTTTTTRGGLRCIHADAEDLHGDAAVRRYARRLAAEHAELSARLRHAGLGEEERRRLNRRCADLAPVADACERIRGAVADLGELVNVLLPSDRLDSSNVVLEVSAGRTTGGDICQQFTREMFDMYQGFASYKNWTFGLLNYTHAEYGGLHHAAVQITGDSVYRHLKHEGGTHRVQRIPEVGLSSRMQRIHTGTMAVIILPQPLELELRIDAKDLRVDTFRSRGAGGQSVNTTDSAVRIVHLPSGTVVECQQSRSQLQNRDTAMAMLRARLHQSVLGQETEKRHTSRKKQVGTRSQSERIRSYNFSQDRVTDHRTGYVSRDLKEFMKGGEALDDLICNVLEHGEREALLDLVERESGVKQPGTGQNVE